MKIVEMVKSSPRIWLVFDELPEKLTYERHGALLIGSDDQGVFYDCLYYQEPHGNMRAFAGREFDLPMKDGSVTHCNGQYWYGRLEEASKVIGEEITEIAASTKEKLRECFVFSTWNISDKKLRELFREFEEAHPDYEPKGHDEYRSEIQNGNGRKERDM